MNVHFEFLNELADIKQQVLKLAARRNEIITENSNIILDKVRGMMDWEKEDIKHAIVEYSAFEKRIMIEVWLKEEPNVRYVFALGLQTLQLYFREDFSKHY